MRVGLMLVARGLLGRVELGAERFLGRGLHLGVDRGVDAEAVAHRAIPADGGDDLLADVIDGVVLPARVLPVAGDQLLRLRARGIAHR